jgi:hypothetical protein
MRPRPFSPWLGGALGLALLAPAALAGEADVVAARAQCDEDRICRFVVTLRHADAGWKHYANRWEVLSLEGELLATRVLRHPHVEEQPFTRALPDVKIPTSLEKVRIRAHDSVHGYGGEELEIELPR